MTFLARRAISRVVYGVDYLVTRKLPVLGEIFVDKNQRTTENQLIGECHMPGDEMKFKISQMLGASSNNVRKYLSKQEGQRVQIGEVLAQRGWWRFQRKVISPLEGTITSIDNKKGLVIIQKDVVKYGLEAGFDGQVVDVQPKLSVDIQVTANILQGLFGFVKNGFASVDILTHDEPLRERHIDGGSCDKLLVSSGRVTLGILKRALSMGVRGIVGASIAAQDWQDYITGQLEKDFLSPEQNGLNLLFTEGFGDLKMREDFWNFFVTVKGKNVLMELSGYDRRPRIVFPVVGQIPDKSQRGSLTKIYAKARKGDRVRLIWGSDYGKQASLTSVRLQEGLSDIEAPGLVKVKFDDGSEGLIPRWNFELL